MGSTEWHAWAHRYIFQRKSRGTFTTIAERCLLQIVALQVSSLKTWCADAIAATTQSVTQRQRGNWYNNEPAQITPKKYGVTRLAVAAKHVYVAVVRCLTQQGADKDMGSQQWDIPSLCCGQHRPNGSGRLPPRTSCRLHSSDRIHVYFFY